MSYVCMTMKLLCVLKANTFTTTLKTIVLKELTFSGKVFAHRQKILKIIFATTLYKLDVLF
jgi:hypothetical protein